VLESNDFAYFSNEKDTEDEADTVGCCSLRVEHLRFREPNFVTFDFLGKDSMRYLNEVEVIGKVFKNLKLFCSKKAETDQIFDQLTTTLLNSYLKTLMPDLTAKVFRTYNASVTLEKELRHSGKDVSLDASIDEKLYFYNK
jgi:DNA topoisomerase-1